MRFHFAIGVGYASRRLFVGTASSGRDTAVTRRTWRARSRSGHHSRPRLREEWARRFGSFLAHRLLAGAPHRLAQSPTGRDCVDRSWFSGDSIAWEGGVMDGRTRYLAEGQEVRGAARQEREGSLRGPASRCHRGVRLESALTREGITPRWTEREVAADPPAAAGYPEAMPTRKPSCQTSPVWLARPRTSNARPRGDHA